MGAALVGVRRLCGNVKRVYLDDLAALLVFFRQRGLEIKLGDAFGRKRQINDRAALDGGPSSVRSWYAGARR